MDKNIVDILQMHSGEFLCHSLGVACVEREEGFQHILIAPQEPAWVSEVLEINEFFENIGSALLYFCPQSEVAAFYLANPKEWRELEDGMFAWIEVLDDDEKREVLPSWFGQHKVIGEVPASGNYLLCVESGAESGAIYIFDHNGLEFHKLVDSLREFILTALDPTPRFLSYMASFMRFVTHDNYGDQWWIKELRHSCGKVVSKEV
ncbi:hypothetical protein [Gilvimarinus algae]|uniref:Knr4/Smi1-like domain-containing protein n=1 Tax=Gilvimarinus algae TaxID=3058037 RepID=A0ABT8TKU3_9GAMM|nr:hypothetical protein [Gilvimarinus sp. SDUM040014]MDO3383978.1 hypothetical protein [Gilvimarinus sp. SDUM040014]